MGRRGEGVELRRELRVGVRTVRLRTGTGGLTVREAGLTARKRTVALAAGVDRSTCLAFPDEETGRPIQAPAFVALALDDDLAGVGRDFTEVGR